MMMMSTRIMVNDQKLVWSRYASCTIAFTLAARMPTTRAQVEPARSPNPARTRMIPTIRTIQPHALTFWMSGRLSSLSSTTPLMDEAPGATCTGTAGAAEDRDEQEPEVYRGDAAAEAPVAERRREERGVGEQVA